jgi:small-conductance mechanosensitive channel
MPRLMFVVFGLALLATAATSQATDVSPKPLETGGLATIEEVLAKRKSLAEKIAALAPKQDAGSTDTDATDVSTAEDELEFLETLDGIYAQQQARLEQRLELQTDKKKADDSLASLRKFGPSEAKPYSFLLLENLRDALAAEEDHLEASVADLKAAEQLLETAHDNFDEAEKERRLAQEELTENEDEEEAGALESPLELAKRRCQIAKELILARRLDVEVRTLRHDLSNTLKEQYAAKVELIGKDVRFTKQDLHDRLKELTDYEAELNKKIAEARSRSRQAEMQQAAALNELRKSKAPQSTIELANEAWRVARDGQQLEFSLLNERIGDNRRFKHYWTCRYEVENGTAKPDQIEEWHESLSDLVDELYDNRRSLEQRIDEVRTEQGKIVRQIHNTDDPVVEQWGEVKRANWQQLREVCEEHLVQLNIQERWSDRFLEELKERLEPEGGESWWTVAQNELATIWDYEIAQVDDRPITVGKIVILIAYIAMGLLLASVLSRLLGRRLLPRFGLNEGAAHAVQSIAFYSLAAVFGVLSFEVVHIPLTAFAFLGGAVAIAVGFGSQDIANNFMSGIIILAEQPIRVGDVVVVDGVQGTVRHIGPRSTRIITDANHEVIVPNSKLLSDKVTNLTLSDTLIQTAVGVSLPLKVGVQRAKSILYRAAASHPVVLQTPEPIVLFKQFGALTMDFELHFWLQLTDNMQAAIAQSDVREAINELFLQCDAQPIIAAIPMPTSPPAGTAGASKAA